MIDLVNDVNVSSLPLRLFYVAWLGSIALVGMVRVITIGAIDLFGLCL